MQTISYSKLRQNLAETMNKTCRDHEVIIITRSKAEAVVMLSLEDYESIMETNYLLQSPKNAARLAESIAEVEDLIAKKKDGR